MTLTDLFWVVWIASFGVSAVALRARARRKTY